jgi:hypothetical protein
MMYTSREVAGTAWRAHYGCGSMQQWLINASIRKSLCEL